MNSKVIAGKLKEFEGTPCYSLFRLLVEALTQEARIRNDVAVEPEFYKNQGVISEFNKLSKLLAPHEIQRGFDGAYGD
jgi:hypothetical protein